MQVDRRSLERGFTLIELLISTALTMVVVGAVLAVADPARSVSSVQLERADMEQRLRHAVTTLSSDLRAAGAGPRGGTFAGPLTTLLAPVLPYVFSRDASDPSGSFRDDAITLFYVPPTAAQTTLRAPITSAGLRLVVDEAGCPLNRTMCGFEAATSLLVSDADGHFDMFRLESISGTEGRLSISSPGGVLQTSYAIGARVTEIVRRTYFVKTSSGVPQLVRNEGAGAADVPVADHVVRLRFEYYGDPQPPRLVAPLDPAGPQSTYGPRPPEPSHAGTAYPVGENCAFGFNPAANLPVPRLAVLGDGRQDAPLVKLAAGQVSDGDAWCPDSVAPHRTEADLLRIRKVVVTVKVEASTDALRGAAGPQFERAGTARDARRFLPDREATFQVTPANLNLRP